MSYGRFAEIYDTLMEEVPYQDWVRFTQSALKVTGAQVESVLDLGAGTGEISIRLAQKGYNVTGVDLSEDMLTIANRKSTEQKASVEWLKQDISSLDMPVQYDMAISYCDVINYMTNEEDVQNTFKNAYEVIKPGGLFLFDVHSIGYIDGYLSGQTFGTVTDEISYIWFCDEEEEDHSVTHDLTFFVQKGDLYERFDEYHSQRTFPVATYVTWLQDCGFNVLGIHSDFKEEAGYDEEENDRIFFICQKSTGQE
ncbi:MULTISPECIES: class I SAM-dependent DNA methyltransferase [Pontibacillus]|uniref:Class I SAM-dependent methyltransferase n=1 Tax=Pontibacillus chungwhensis TaxID=265426 RepID=A0ABY8UUK0_9BACI|nr:MULTISPECIES: class I SAM-dependent methyltransferase [Pontibacillus]MCD5323643.1 class I SAM-dependent methyltransferase [Pontibacillus sp. HN14]WIF97010.1 class I SAM-dependent methyltransferase [Pontibacillus chungwhensis]